MTATDRIRAATAAADDAQAALNQSRWPWIRRRAEQRMWRREEYARTLALSGEARLIAEASDRVANRAAPEHPWQRPDITEVLEDVRSISRHVIATEESVARVLYNDTRLSMSRDDLTLVETHARGLDFESYAHVLKRNYTTKPNGGVSLGEPLDIDLVDLLRSPQALLPRPVTVWRGEHPSDREPTFANAVRTARPGDILQRSQIVSCSLDPATAAAYEFTHVGTLRAPRLSSTGWVLQVQTQRLLYAGIRNERAPSFDALAPTEKEALIDAARLQVIGHREAIVYTRHGLKRIHVVSCRADA